MNTRMTLAEALHRAGHELESLSVPPGLLARVQAQAQANSHAGPPTALPPASAADAPRWSPARLGSRLRRHWLASGATACAAVVVSSVLLMLGGPALEPLAPELRMSAPGRSQALIPERFKRGGTPVSGFVPVVPTERWPSEDTAAWLVSTELQRDRLAALGLPFDPARAGESVRAELLVRPSGQVLAVRFVE